MKKSFSWRVHIAGFAGMTLLLVFFSRAAAQNEYEGRWYGEPVIVPASQVIDGDYFAFGPLVEVSGMVNGDVYAFGGQILIDGRINGDVLVAGGRVSISGNVAQDVRTAGGQVSLSGNIGRNLTVSGGNVDVTRSAVVRGSLVGAGGNLHVAAPIGGGMKVAAGSLIISNRVEGNVDAAVGRLRLTSKAEVQGDVNYLSHREASVDAGAQIKGKIARTAAPKIPRPGREKILVFFAAWGLFMIAVSVVSTLVLGLLSVRFLPRYHASVVTVLRQKPWASLGIGFIAAVVTPVVCAILFATVFGIPIGLILTASYIILLYWGRIFVVSRVGEALLGLFRRSSSQGWAFISGIVVYYLLAVIPLIGWLLVLFVVIFGLGAELIARKDFYVAARRQEMI